MAVPMGEITRALVGVRRRLCVKWGFVDMDAYEQEYRFCYFARCPYEKTDMTFRSIPLTTESFPQKEGGEAVWVLIIFTVSNPIYSHSIEFRRCCSRTRGSGIFLPMPRCCMAFCLTANGLMGVCDIIPKSSAKPGDLIFFQSTYDTSGASHVGIYVGNGMMIHCGNPISYASIESNYWQQHFYCFGRIRN